MALPPASVLPRDNNECYFFKTLLKEKFPTEDRYPFFWCFVLCVELFLGILHCFLFPVSISSRTIPLFFLLVPPTMAWMRVLVLVIVSARISSGCHFPRFIVLLNCGTFIFVCVYARAVCFWKHYFERKVTWREWCIHSGYI